MRLAKMLDGGLCRTVPWLSYKSIMPRMYLLAGHYSGEVLFLIYHLAPTTMRHGEAQSNDHVAHARGTAPPLPSIIALSGSALLNQVKTKGTGNSKFEVRSCLVKNAAMNRILAAKAMACFMKCKHEAASDSTGQEIRLLV